MYGFTMTPVAISGARGPRPTLFGGAANDFFGMGASSPQPALSQHHYALGQTAENYYTRAKPAVAKFDSLVERVKRIANKAARDRIVSDFGLSNPANTDKALYDRNTVASSIARAESFSPVSYEEGFPTHGPSRREVRDLEKYNRDFEAAVKAAEDEFGVLPEPVIIERIVTREVQVPGAAAPSGASSIIPYVVVGGIGLAVLAAFGVFGGR